MWLFIVVVFCISGPTVEQLARTETSLQIYHTLEQLLRLRKAPQCSIPPPGLFQLTRIEPNQVGDVEWMNLVEGKTHMRITRARHPPIFEVPGFLTADECAHIVNKSTSHLRISQLSGIQYEKYEGDLKEAFRVSKSTAFFIQDADPVFEDITERITKLTEIPRNLVEETEPIQVVHYDVGGHYHSHFDSSNFDKESNKQCHHHCTGLTRETEMTCELCRYITILLYLNNVEEGGETAFLVADNPHWRDEVQDINLSYSCHKNSLVIEPKQGKAVMWYNNFVDPETGLLAEVDEYSKHGGCDILKGEKWIANYWINASKAKTGYKPSKYITKWT